MTELNSSLQDISSIHSSASARYQRWRKIKDSIAKYGVIAGGLGVIVAIVLIFFYLLYVVMPLFFSASATATAEYQTPAPAMGDSLLLAVEEQNEVAVRFTTTGQAVFFAAKSGEIISEQAIGVPENVNITSFAQGDPTTGIVIYGLSDGRAILVKQKYQVTYPNDVRLISPKLEYPLGTVPIQVDQSGQALIHLAVKSNVEATIIAAITDDHRVLYSSFSREESLFSDEGDLLRVDATLDVQGKSFNRILIDKDQNTLFLANKDGQLSFFDISNKEDPELKQHLNVIEAGNVLSSLTFLNGDLSLLVGDSKGTVSQWSMVRDENNRPALQQLRMFKVADSDVLGIASEQRRKGFLTYAENGEIGIYHSTAERQLLTAQVSNARPVSLALSPRANALLLEDSQGKVHFWNIDNEHPEVSIKSIWQEVWYESYPQPDYIWQSSSASNDFEPKFSLTPLVFGTLKAAFYAMLMAVPLAIMGAVYTAYFMAPKMRRLVKPSIEIMEALPTVILGFLAGLWLAPLIEEQLAAVFSLFVIVPMVVMSFAFCWQLLPAKYSGWLPEGWDAALLIPVIIVAVWLAFVMSQPLEAVFFAGDLRDWFNKVLGISYDQRNSLVVGLAMGFAVIPTIFSITEDAIFSVPKHLTLGSLALGATPWQTMVRVVLLTASPGIFSAVMIGFGRAVGETMIVLMATGNTPVMDLSIFQGMRTLSANIAVEMPESEVDSTHYRVLFLAALVLFLFTFVFNTVAEVVRQHLREKYSSL